MKIHVKQNYLKSMIIQQNKIGKMNVQNNYKYQIEIKQMSEFKYIFLCKCIEFLIEFANRIIFFLTIKHYFYSFSLTLI